MVASKKYIHGECVDIAAKVAEYHVRAQGRARERKKKKKPYGEGGHLAVYL